MDKPVGLSGSTFTPETLDRQLETKRRLALIDARFFFFGFWCDIIVGAAWPQCGDEQHEWRLAQLSLSSSLDLDLL